MIGGEIDHLLETGARAFVVEVVERFIALGAQGVEACLLVLGGCRHHRKKEDKYQGDEFHVRQDYKIYRIYKIVRDSYQTALRPEKGTKVASSVADFTDFQRSQTAIRYIFWNSQRTCK